MRLEASKLGFKYGQNPWLIRNFSLSVSSGEVIGLNGHSGSGKTTVARILSGYEQAQEGRVLLDGIRHVSRGFNPVQLIFQHPERSVNPRWRLRDTVNEGWPADSRLMERMGIEAEWLDRWPNELSGGELQRFCIVRAMSPLTRFIIADEMTTMLDAITQAQIWELMLEFARERNLGVIVVSHEQNLVRRLCDRIINLEDHLSAGKESL